MANKLKTYLEKDSQTRYFFLNWAIYGIAIIASTVYCYGRLNYVRSYSTAQADKTNQTTQKK